MDKNYIQNKINQLEERKKDKLINIEQAEKVIVCSRVEIIGIEYALKEFKVMLNEQVKNERD